MASNAAWWLGWCVIGLGVAGCSPTHNWRNVQPDGTPLQALMPCKPEQAERTVPLLGPGQPGVTLHMLGCEVGASTFALAAVALPAADKGTPALAEAALTAWSRATWASLRQAVPDGQASPPGWVVQAAAVPGAERAQRWGGPALDHRGQALRAEVLWAAGRGWLVQAAMYGPAPEALVQETFFESVRLP